MIFNRLNNGAEELRLVTSSYYANADFEKIEGMVVAAESELARVVGGEVMLAIEADYNAGNLTPIVRAAQRAVGFMATLRYFRLNDISHETDGRKVKMDSENERRPFEWQLERDDEMHLAEYYEALDELVTLLMNDAHFKRTTLYSRISSLLVANAGDVEGVTGVACSPHLFLRLVPFLHDAQRHVASRLGSDPLTISDDTLKYYAQSAIGNRAIALFVQKTEMQALPAGAFREAVSGGGRSMSSTTTQLHDYCDHLLRTSENFIHDMQHLRDELAGENADSHVIMPKNCQKNKFFRW